MRFDGQNTAHRKVSLIIPVFNSMKYLGTCLDSVLAARERYEDLHLILLDHGSTDGSYQTLIRRLGDSDAKIIRVEGGTIAALRNFGARTAEGSFLCFLDSDCVIPEDYFEGIMSVFTSVAAEATGQMVQPAASANWLQSTWCELNRHVADGYVPYLNAANFAIKRDAFDKVGGFDEALITGEDSELCWRLTAAGYKIYESHRVGAVHLGEPSSVRNFLRQQVWHGLGMFGTFRRSWFDKPVLATLAHLCFGILGLFGLFMIRLPVWFRVGAFLLSQTAVPMLTTAYRAAPKRELYRPLRSVVLYYLYFVARSWALFKLCTLRTGLRLRPQHYYHRRDGQGRAAGEPEPLA